ncbi:hypothetical protein CYR55_22290, partial [Chimaeribacter californicus]
ATYAIGKETAQVNSASTVQAAEIVVLASTAKLASNQLELCKVTIPAGATQITTSMIDLSGRIMQTLGIQLSSAIDSSSETVGANSLAVKNAIVKVEGEIATSVITKQLTVNGTTTVTGAVTMGSSLTVAGTLVAKSTLDVTGALSAGGDITASKSLTVAGQTTLAGGANVTGGLSIMGDTTSLIMRPATVDSGYYIRGKKNDGTSHWYLGQASNSTDVVQWGNSLGGSAINLGLSGSIGMVGSVSISSALTASGDITGSGALAVTGAAVLGNTLKVTGATTLSSSLTVVSEAAFGGGLNLGGSYTGGDAGKSTGIYGGADGASTTTTNMLIKSWYGVGFYNTSAAGTAGITAYLNVRTGYFYTTGSIGAAGALAVTGTTTLSNWLKVTGATTLSSTLTVSGAVSAGGDITASGALILTGAATMGSTLNVTGALTGTDATFTQSVVANYRMGVIRSGGLPYTTYARTDLPDGTLPTSDTQVMAIQAKTGSTTTNFDGGRILGLLCTYYTTLGGGRNVLQARNSASTVTSQLTMDGDLGTLSITGAVSMSSTLNLTGKAAINGGLAVTGGTVMQADNGVLYLKPATTDKAYYIQAQKGDGTRHWFLGQSTDSSDVVVLSSYLTTASVQLYDNTVKLTAATTKVSSALAVTSAASIGGSLTVSGSTVLVAATTIGSTLSTSGAVTSGGGFISKAFNGFRLINGESTTNRGAFLRIDESAFYVLMTDAGNSLGDWNSLRPLTINLATGKVDMNHGLGVQGDFANTGNLTTSGNILANNHLYSNNYVYAGGGTGILAGDGNVYGSRWGGWLSNYVGARNTAGLGTTGWWRCGSTGMIIQWGVVSMSSNPGEGGAYVNFPITFPNVCCVVSPGRWASSDGSTHADGDLMIVATSQGGFTGSTQQFSDSTADLRGYSWMAIGY